MTAHDDYTPFDHEIHNGLTTAVEDAVAKAAAIRHPPRPDIMARPGEGSPTDPIAPIDWHNIAPEDHQPTMDALADFLAWAVPRWNFTADQFPYDCWWQHPDIVEEMTAWWTLWQAYIRNPYAHPADPMAFHERTSALKLRLATNYRGRCRKGHEPVVAPSAVAKPPTLTPPAY